MALVEWLVEKDTATLMDEMCDSMDTLWKSKEVSSETRERWKKQMKKMWEEYAIEEHLKVVATSLDRDPDVAVKNSERHANATHKRAHVVRKHRKRRRRGLMARYQTKTFSARALRLMNELASTDTTDVKEGVDAMDKESRGGEKTGISVASPSDNWKETDRDESAEEVAKNQSEIQTSPTTSSTKPLQFVSACKTVSNNVAEVSGMNAIVMGGMDMGELDMSEMDMDMDLTSAFLPMMSESERAVMSATLDVKVDDSSADSESDDEDGSDVEVIYENDRTNLILGQIRKAHIDYVRHSGPITFRLQSGTAIVNSAMYVFDEAFLEVDPE